MQRAPRFEECQQCGKISMCSIYEGPQEEETGYRDEIALCEERDDTDEREDWCRPYAAL